MRRIALALALSAACSPLAAGGLREIAVLGLPASSPGGPLRRVEAIIQRPARAKGRLPAFVVLGGVETGARVLDYLRPTVPAVLATFEYPYKGPRRFEFPRTILDAREIRGAVADTPAAVRALHRALRAKPYVDGERVCLVGASFAAPFVLRAAAEDPAARCLVIVEGFADVRGTAAFRIHEAWRPRLGPLARPAAWAAAGLVTLALRPPRPESDVPRLRAGQRVLVIDAAGDTTLPAASREGLWRLIERSPAAARRIVVPGEHLLGGRSASSMGEITSIVERWLRER